MEKVCLLGCSFYIRPTSFSSDVGEKRDITESRGVQRSLSGAKSPSQLAAARSGNILCALLVWWQGPHSGSCSTALVGDCAGHQAPDHLPVSAIS